MMELPGDRKFPSDMDNANERIKSGSQTGKEYGISLCITITESNTRGYLTFKASLWFAPVSAIHLFSSSAVFILLILTSITSTLSG